MVSLKGESEMKARIEVGSKVLFNQVVIRRLGHDKRAADMRGVVLEIAGNRHVAVVDCGDTYTSEDGRKIRSFPLANLALDRIESFLD